MSPPTDSEHPQGNPSEGEPWYSSLWHKFTGAINTVYTDVKSGLQSVWHGVTGIFHKTLNTAKEATLNLENKAAAIINKGESVIDHGFKEVGHTARDLGDNFEKTAGSLSMPIMIAGGAAILFLLLQRSGQLPR